MGVVKFGRWAPRDPEQWPAVLDALARWTASGKALLYNDEHVPVDIGSLDCGSSVITLDAQLEVYDAELWRLWAAAGRGDGNLG
jgi:hypothetical protein